MPKTNADFTLRSFLAEVEARDPAALWRISDRVALDHDVTALAMELEQHGKAPVLWFERVGDSPFPVIANLFARRDRYALGLGVAPDQLIREWGIFGDRRIKPVMHHTGPVRDIIMTGADVDLARLPIMLHFDCDAGRYITNGILIAKDPIPAVRNASFHRMQVNGRNRLGTSLHSRRDLWNYAQRAEERGEDIPIAIVIGAHPTFTFGGLWKGPISTDEYDVIGGMMGVPLEIAAGVTVPVEHPIHAEIVLEGRILAKAREPKALLRVHRLRLRPIDAARDRDLGDPAPARRPVSRHHSRHFRRTHQPARRAAGSAVVENTARPLPERGSTSPTPNPATCRLHAYIAVRRAAPGMARVVAAAAFGDDLSLKLVVVVDDDVDIHDDSDVLWAMATRMQANQDIDILRNGMGAILDPSNNNGLTDKMIIDATRPPEGISGSAYRGSRGDPEGEGIHKGQKLGVLFEKKNQKTFMT